jgi:hypothetical protein
MSLRNAYVEVAFRYIRSATAAANASIQEAATFQTYHAFESIGGALAELRNHKYPKAHYSKLNVFVALSKRTKYAHPVAELAIILASLRNKALYPEVNAANGTVMRPSNRIAAPQATKLIARVRGIIQRVSTEV